MEKIQRNRILWKIPLLVTILVAIFWGLCYLASGEVPVITQIKWNEDTIIDLPFPMSRLWDIPFASVWAVVLIFFFINRKTIDSGELVLCLIFGLFLSVIAHITVGAGPGLGAGLIFGVGASLVFGLVATRLITGLVIGLGFGLGIGLAAGLGADLCAGLGAGLKFIFFQKNVDSLDCY